MKSLRVKLLQLANESYLNWKKTPPWCPKKSSLYGEHQAYLRVIEMIKKGVE